MFVFGDLFVDGESRGNSNIVQFWIFVLSFNIFPLTHKCSIYERMFLGYDK